MTTKTLSTFAALMALATATDAKFKAMEKKEKPRDFIVRLMETLSESAQEAFDELPEAAQEWFNVTATALNSDGEVSLPEGHDEAPAEAEKPAKGSVAKGSVKGSVAKGSVKKDEAKKKDDAPKEKKITKSYVIRSCIIKKQDVTADEIKAELAAKGFHDVAPATITTYLHDTRETLRIATELGWTP